MRNLWRRSCGPCTPLSLPCSSTQAIPPEIWLPSAESWLPPAHLHPCSAGWVRVGGGGTATGPRPIGSIRRRGAGWASTRRKRPAVLDGGEGSLANGGDQCLLEHDVGSW